MKPIQINPNELHSLEDSWKDRDLEKRMALLTKSQARLEKRMAILTKSQARLEKQRALNRRQHERNKLNNEELKRMRQLFDSVNAGGRREVD